MTILIPVRAGSKRIPNKAVRDFGGKALVWWTLRAATLAATHRDTVVLVSNMPEADAVARQFPKVEIYHRSDDNAQDGSPDINWLMEVAPRYCKLEGDLMVLRVTAPYRSPFTIKMARDAWVEAKRLGSSSLRAVTMASAHPGKMWVEQRGALLPVLPFTHASGVPWHSAPTQTLPVVFQQTAGLEITTWVGVKCGTLAGGNVAPFFVRDADAVDLNSEYDWQAALAVYGVPSWKGAK